uniref:WW domain-containing protein n=1 Tax=Mycena chlorophos TaxID=658473 RepID=A0ABQ0LGV3_MYCCL|nr:predicted protein [Mycena chlorophos]
MLPAKEELTDLEDNDGVGLLTGVELEDTDSEVEVEEPTEWGNEACNAKAGPSGYWIPNAVALARTWQPPTLFLQPPPGIPRLAAARRSDGTQLPLVLVELGTATLSMDYVELTTYRPTAADRLCEFRDRDPDGYRRCTYLLPLIPLSLTRQSMQCGSSDSRNDVPVSIPSTEVFAASVRSTRTVSGLDALVVQLAGLCGLDEQIAPRRAVPPELMGATLNAILPPSPPNSNFTVEEMSQRILFQRRG